VSVSTDSEAFEMLRHTPAVPLDVAARALFRDAPDAVIAGERVAVPLTSCFHLPALRARIDGAGALLLLDTGARYSYANARVAQRAGVRLLPDVRVHLTFLGEPVPAQLTLASSVEIDGIRWFDVPFFVTLRRTRLHVLGITLRELEGGIGADLIRSFRVTLDARAGLVTFEPPAAAPRPLPQGAVSLPLDLLPDGRPAVDVSINGHAPERFLFDTCSTQLTLDAEAARAFGVPIDESRTGRTLGFGTRAEVLSASVSALALGSLILRDLEADIPVRTNPDFARNGFRGILGFHLLREHRVTLDFPARRLVIEIDRP